MKTKINLLDVVALTVDLPEYNLWRGQVGTVVEILADGKAFEVEFSDRNGRTYESIGLRPDQIMALHFEPVGSYLGSLPKIGMFQITINAALTMYGKSDRESIPAHILKKIAEEIRNVRLQ